MQQSFIRSLLENKQAKARLFKIGLFYPDSSIRNVRESKRDVALPENRSFPPEYRLFKRIHPEPKKFYAALVRELPPQKLDELKTRRTLNYAGFNTYPRPRGLPSNIVIEFSKKNGGMAYRVAGTTKEQSLVVRVCPGLAKESIVSSVIKGKHLNGKMHGTLRQQYPYVVQRKGKKYLTTSGKWVDEAGPTTHISLEIYEFKGWE